MPQIYYQPPYGADMPHQWKAVSLYSILAKNNIGLEFDSQLSEDAACHQRTCAVGYLSTAASWQALVDALAEDPRTAWTPSFASDIRWDPS